MSSIVKSRSIPIILYAISVLIPILSAHLNIADLQTASKQIISWGSYLANFAFFLGIYNVSVYHYKKIKTKEKGNWVLSIIALGSMFIMLALGFISQTSFQWVFNNIFTTLGVAVFCFISFYWYSFIYRGFKIRNVDALVLVISTAAVMFLYLPLLTTISPGFYQFGDWVSSVPSLAGLRGLMIGVAIGMVALTVRTILGHERGFLGGGE